MRKANKYLIYSVFILSIIGLVIISQIYQKNNTKNLPYNYNTKNPLIKSSYGALNSTDIYLNDTEIITLFDTIKIDVNTSQYYFANYTEILFIYADGSSFIDNMTHTVQANFTYNYTAPYNIPTGIHSIYFQIYDDTDSLLNNNKTETTFIVKSNYYSADFLKDELYIGDLLSISLTIKNTTEHNFIYNVAIVDSTNEQAQTNLKFIGNNIEWFNITADESLFGELNKVYYIKVNLTDESTGKVNATYFPFQILNHNPQIIESTIKFSSLEIFRSNVNNCRVSLNVTDIEDDNPANLSVIMTLTDLFGTNKIQYPLSNIGNNFSTDFHIGINSPIGIYKINITAIDLNGGATSYFSDIEVKNNPPQFNLYLINGKLPTETISIDYGEDIIFAFDIRDKDNNIEYITVTLISDEYKFFIISTVNQVLSINSAELESGVWYVFISATDSDGSTINLTSDYGLAPQQIKIIANTLENIMPWITLIIGIVAGLLIGFALGYKLLKSRRKIKEPSREEPISEKAPQKIKRKAEKPKEEAEKKEEEKEEKKPTKRKIKRKL